MWCVIILALGVWSSCLAMDEGVTVYRDSSTAGSEIEMRRVPNNGVLWELARKYHVEKQIEELEKAALSKKDHAETMHDVIVDEEKVPLYVRCINYLDKYQHDAALSTDEDRSYIVHALDNKLVVVPMPTEKSISYDQAIILNTKNESDEITFNNSSICLLVRGGKWVIGIDSLKRIHEWFIEKDAQQESTYINWQATVPGNITSIHQLARYLTIIFYQDEDEIHRAGFMHRRNVYSRNAEFKIEKGFVPSGIRNATHVTVREGSLGWQMATVHSKYWSRSYHVHPIAAEGEESLGEWMSPFNLNQPYF